MIDKKHPTHAVRHVSNWDGEHDVLTSLCVLDETTNVFHYWDGGKPVLEYVGDEIIHAWALTDQMADMERNARRYLALRNAAKTQEGRVKVQAIFWHMGSRKDIDAAADRLLEGGE